MKTLTLVYCGDGDAAKAVAARLRDKNNGAQCRDGFAFDGNVEPCDSVVIMPDLPGFHKDRIAAAYGDLVVRDEQQPQDAASEKPRRRRKRADP